MVVTLSIYPMGLPLVLLTTLATISSAQGSHWQRLPRIGLGPRQEHAVASLGTSIYILGGIAADSGSNIRVVNTVEVFDTSSQTWAVSAPFPHPINHANAAGVGDNLYVFGGLNDGKSQWDAQPHSYVYSPWNDTWTPIAPVPAGTARGASAVGVHGDLVYLAGGMTYLQQTAEGAQDAVATVSSYDTVSDTWRSDDLPPLPEPRQHVCGAVVNGTFYVLGGRTDGRGKVQGSVFALDLEDMGAGWRSLTPMPTPRGGLGCAAVEGKIHCVGGEKPGHGAHGVYEEVEVYDVASDSWESLEPMAVPRHGTNAVAVDGKIYVPGGGTKTGAAPVGVMDAYVP
ncbi:hypothetical protein F5B20DRAFT_323388 [Whalleya microplaca]|nr:hypothetical protein F5B20DRAFT_323388 [Whalleya microplaca]